MGRQCMQRSFLYVFKIYASMAHRLFLFARSFEEFDDNARISVQKKNYNEFSYYSLYVLLTKRRITHTHLCTTFLLECHEFLL